MNCPDRLSDDNAPVATALRISAIVVSSSLNVFSVADKPADNPIKNAMLVTKGANHP
jgi:hypothetical protein